jgi:ABC-type lipoprotein export system ATPase subunit
MSKNTTPLMVVHGLSRHYDHDSVRALDGVTFEAFANEVVALTGPSGCGKSTLLSILGLLDQPTFGHVCIGGEDLAQVRPAGLFRARNIGFVFQFHHMVPTMTLLENVIAPMIALGVTSAERRHRATELLARVGLSARANFLPAKVSGGERQRAAVARALINRPQVILADEPTGNLDSTNGQLVIDLLIEHARSQGALVLLATHNPEIAAATDRQLEMRDGRLVETDEPRRSTS